MYEAFMCVPEFGVFLGEVFLGFVFRIVSPLSVINICTEYIYIQVAHKKCHRNTITTTVRNVIGIRLLQNCLKCYRQNCSIIIGYQFLNAVRLGLIFESPPVNRGQSDQSPILCLVNEQSAILWVGPQILLEKYPDAQPGTAFFMVWPVGDRSIRMINHQAYFL